MIQHVAYSTFSLSYTLMRFWGRWTTHAKPFFTNYYIHGLDILKYDQWTLQWQWIRFDINICDSPLLKSRNISSMPLFSFADVWKCLAPTDAAYLQIKSDKCVRIYDLTTKLLMNSGLKCMIQHHSTSNHKF